MTIDSDVHVRTSAGIGVEWPDSAHGGQSFGGSASPVFTHVELKHLMPEAESFLRNIDGSWLGSYGFSTLYAFPPATNAWVKTDNQAHVVGACHFVEQAWKGLFKSLHIFGPTDLGIQELRQLLRERRAAVATITCMGPEHVTRLPRSWARCTSSVVSEDIVLELPRSEEDYLRSLGQNARTQLPYYLRRVQKEWGKDYALFFARGSEITLELFTELVELNRGRIERKGTRHLWHPQLIKQRWRLAQECGLFCGLRRGNALVAGTMSYLHRGDAYFILIGHHTDYDRLRLGKLVLWATIKRLIHMGFDRYHLLWGKSSYKEQMGGQPSELSEVTVFRHPVAASLWHSDRLMHRFVSGIKKLGRIPRALVGQLKVYGKHICDRGGCEHA